MTNMTRICLGALLVCLAAVAGGCNQVAVSLDTTDPGLKDSKGVLKSIEVNIVAVSNAELPKWEQMSVSQYWEPGNQMRQSALKVVMTFGEGKQTEQVLKGNDPIWDQWSDRYAKNMLILANLSGIPDQPGAADPRRLILRDYKGLWSGKIKVLLRSGGLTPMKGD